MKIILVIGGTGQIGSELIMKLRSIYGNSNVVLRLHTDCSYPPANFGERTGRIVDITKPH